MSERVDGGKWMNHETLYKAGFRGSSMLDVHLDLSSQVFVIVIALLQLEVDKETVVVVEAQELIARRLIAFELLFEGDGVAAALDVR